MHVATARCPHSAPRTGSLRAWPAALALALVWLWTVPSLAGPAGPDPRDPNPLRPPDTSSPKATLDEFLAELRTAYRLAQEDQGTAAPALDALDRAKRCLDLQGVPADLADDVATESALLLKEVLDRIALPPDADRPDAHAMQREGVTRWVIPGTEIRIAQVDKGSRQGEYLFSPDTVAQAAAFYRRVSDLPYGADATPGLYVAYTLTPGGGIDLAWSKRIPPWLGQVYAGQALWQWLAAAGMSAFGLAIGWATYGVGRRWDLSRSDAAHASRFGRVLALLLGIGVAALVDLVVDNQVNLTGRVRIVAVESLVVLRYGLLIWALALAFTQIPEAIISSRRLRPRGLDSQLLRFGFRLLATVVIAALAIDAANRIGLPAYSVIAGLGVGGLAVALAARETLANLFGSLMIMVDRPFRIGDRVVMGEHAGTVEDIGFRSTRLRTDHDSILAMPNSETVTATVDNLGAASARRTELHLSVRYDTPPETIEAFLEGVKCVIQANATAHRDRINVVLHDFGDSGLTLLVAFHLRVADRPHELVERQRILIEVLRLARTLGVEFAFPTRTIALDRRAGNPADPDAAALAELVALAHGFGTAGPLARPQGLGAYVPAHEEAGPGPSSSGRTT